MCSCQAVHHAMAASTEGFNGTNACRHRIRAQNSRDCLPDKDRSPLLKASKNGWVGAGRVFESFPIFLRQQQIRNGVIVCLGSVFAEIKRVLKLFVELILRAGCFGAGGLIKSRDWGIYGVGILAARSFDPIRSNALFSIFFCQECEFKLLLSHQ